MHERGRCQDPRPVNPRVRRTAGWVFCRRAFRLPNGAGERGHSADLGQYWPDPARQEPLFRRVVERLQRLTLPVMRAVLAHLGEAEESFDTRLTASNFGLRLNYYPPVR